MKLPIAIAILFVATSTALPALAAIPNHHASHPSALRSPNAESHRDVIPNWPCIRHSRDDSGTYSAYPNWEMCD
jgi:hypothetical protein